MRDDYKIQASCSKFEVEVESEVVHILSKMASHSKHSVSELANAALKRFISAHKDFLPPEDGGIR